MTSDAIDPAPAVQAFDAIIFDCDGVLVDSEILASRTLASLISERIQGNLSAEDLMTRFVGRTDRDILAIIGAEHGVVFPETFTQQLDQAIDRALIEALEPVDGAADAVAAIALPRAVASNSPHRRVVRSLERTGLQRLFGDHLYCADQVARPKPEPDVYLLAASRLGAAPGRCLVVEDSAPGVTAAVAAGMTVIGFLGASHIRSGHDARLRAAGAATLVHRMADLPGRVMAMRPAGPNSRS